MVRKHGEDDQVVASPLASLSRRLGPSGRLPRALLPLAPVTSSRRLLPVLGVLATAGAYFAEATSGRSLAVLIVFGVLGTLWGYGLLTDWGSVRTRHLQQESERVKHARAYPLAATRAGRLAIALNRRDHEAWVAHQGASGIVLGPMMFVAGVLFALGLVPGL